MESSGGRLAGKVVLITGAARGIGKAAARRMIAEGASLSVCDLDAAELAAMVETLPNRDRVHQLAGDASSSTFVDTWVDAAVAEFDRVDVLYCNVGVSIGGLVGDLSDDDWRTQQRLTLDTTFCATRAVLPHMIRQRSGSIIAMSSGAGIGGQYNLGGYAAAKAAVINLMETVALEYGPYGIRANSLTPGPTATEPFLDYYRDRPGEIEGLSDGLDLKRLSLPEEVANTILWLASDESSNITGICVRSNIRSASARP